MQTDKWRWGLLAREASRNVFGRGSRLYPLLVIGIILGAGQVLFAAFESEQLSGVLADLDQKGRNVLIYGAADTEAPVAIDTKSCEALSTIDGVARAGVVTGTQRVDIVPLGSQLSLFRASSTLYPLLDEYDALVGDSLGLDSSRIIISGNQVLGAAVLAHQPEGTGSNSSVVVSLSLDDTTAPLCVVITDKFTNPSSSVGWIESQLKVSGGELSGAPVLRLSSDPIVDFGQRPAQYLPVLLGLVGGLATGILFRLRSSELATYRLSGSSARSVALLLFFESLFITGIATLSASAAAYAVEGYLIDLHTVLLRSVLFGAVWIVGAILMSAGVAFRRAIDLAKDR